MKNITVSVDDETYLQARIWAAWHSTSVSGLFRQFLESLYDSPHPPPAPRKSAADPPGGPPTPRFRR